MFLSPFLFAQNIKLYYNRSVNIQSDLEERREYTGEYMIYLIDYENVREHGLKNITYKRDDMIYLFYTENAAKIELDALSEIEAAMKFIKVAAGKQSLDMHLISYLGYLISEQNGRTEFVIVSNDTGYDGVLRFWQNKGYKTSRRLVNTAAKTGSSGNRSSRGTRSRSRSLTRRQAEAPLVEELVETVKAAEETALETADQAQIQVQPAEEAAALTDDAQQKAAETAAETPETTSELRTGRRSRRSRRKKSEPAEAVRTETEEPENSAAESETA